tara:strand:- start:103 stop:1638 length:1536 start_codon:yes stop_codon:yes gene_type:complete
MAWSQQFIDSLDRKAKVISYVLKFLPPSKDYSLSFGDQHSLTTEIKIASADVTIDTVQITPQRWSVNFGGFSIVLNGDLRPVLNTSLRKGAVAELLMVRDGIRNRVSIGQLRNIVGGRGVWRLEFVDFLTMMQSRLTNKTSESAFWRNAGKKAKVTTNYNFSSDPNLYLDDITIFEKQTGQNGMIFVTDSVHNASDYWTWSSKTTTTGSAGYLTIASTGNYPSTASHSDLHINDKVTSIVRLRGRPDYVFARLVMSTGAGTQGVFDDYPESWGMGVEWYPSLFDVQSLNAYYAKAWTTSSGIHEIELLIMQSGGINTFLDAVLKMGMWPVWRQNELSWRVCQNPNQASWMTVIDNITDRDIVSIDSHALYSPSQSATYSVSTINTYNSTTSLNQDVSFSGNSIAVLPASSVITRDLRLIYRVDSPIQPTQATADLTRMRRWDAEPFEELSLTVTEKHCLLTAGDIVQISSMYIYGLREGSGDTYNQRRAMVLGVRWNPSKSTVNLTLGVMS